MSSISALDLAASVYGSLEQAITLHGHLSSHKYPARDAATEATLDTLQRRIAGLLCKDKGSISTSLDSDITALHSKACKTLKSFASAAESLPAKSHGSVLDRLKLSGRQGGRATKSNLESLAADLVSIRSQLGEEILISLSSTAHHALDNVSSSASVSEMDALEAAVKSLHFAVSHSTSNEAVFNALQSAQRRVEGILSQHQQSATLSALGSKLLHERFDTITQAEASTFNWLLDTEGNTEVTSSLARDLEIARTGFMKWLEAGSGCFYISGKPGAGKSTLMKFICCHDLFYERAKLWSGTENVLVGKFFFWKPGHPEQKSLNGMLRGLLYSVLQKSPELSAIAFPGSLNRGKQLEIDDNHVELAFDNLLRDFNETSKYSVMLFIDGLDEFEGEHDRLLNLLQNWVTKYPSRIKICVSSREYGVFETFFKHSPKFRLHQLTRGDMLHLIRSRLQASTAYSKLSGRNDELVENLIGERAEGVFLWVVLVIAAMEDGLESGDITTALELESSIERCPTELDDLLPYLLKSVTEHHRPWAYKAITLVHYAQFKVSQLLESGKSYAGVGLLDLMLLDEASPSWNLAMFQPRSESKSADVSFRLMAARKKIICRCRGFLSVANLSQARSWPSDGTERLYVTFSHRAVVEFLNEDLATNLMSTYLGDFDPFFALTSTVLACLRFLPPTELPLLKPTEQRPEEERPGLSEVLEDSIITRWDEIIECAAASGKAGSSRFLNILDAIGDALKRHLTLLMPIQRIRLSPAEDSPHQVLIHLTFSHLVYEYSEWRRRQTQSVQKTPMGNGRFNAFHKMVSRLEQSTKPDPETSQASFKHLDITSDRILKLLLEFSDNCMDLNWPPVDSSNSRNNLNSEGKSWTCWQNFLWAILLCKIPHAESYFEFLQALLLHGADQSLVIVATEPVGPLKLERLAPHDDGFLLLPFTDMGAEAELFHANDNIDGDVETKQRARMPAVLVREDAPIYQQAKSQNWTFTFRELVEIWFPQRSEDLLNQVKNSKDSSVGTGEELSASRTVCSAAIFGDTYEACSVGSVVEEIMTQAA